MPLNSLLVRSIKPSEKTKKYFDGNGLLLVVYKTGKKAWRVKYRFCGKEKLVTLGKYPQISLKEARFLCAKIKRELEKGIDPAIEKAKKKLSVKLLRENTLRILAKEWFDSYKSPLSANYAMVCWQRLEVNLLRVIGDRPITEITAQELLAVLRKVENRGAIEQAHRLLNNCAQIYQSPLESARQIEI